MTTLGRTAFKVWGWAGVALYFWMAGRLAMLLISPGPDDGMIIVTFIVVMVFEFLLVQSGVMMTFLPRRVSLIIIVPAYGLFALLFNAMLPGHAILWLYMSVMFARMRFAFSDPTAEAKKANGLFSIAAATTYIVLLLIFSIVAETLPQFGLNNSYLYSINYQDLQSGSSGVFVDFPQAPILMGAVYFALLGIYEGAIAVATPSFSPDPLFDLSL